MRNTSLQKAILNILETQSRPLTIPEILEYLGDQKLHPNKTSVYRHMEKFAQGKKVATMILDSDVTHYEIQKHHHHHFVCQKCKKVEPIADKDLEKNIHDIESALEKKGLKVSDHQFSLLGLCQSCTS